MWWGWGSGAAARKVGVEGTVQQPGIPACVSYLLMDGGESVAGESHRKSEGEFECGLDVSSALGMLSAICLCGAGCGDVHTHT